MVQLLRRLRQKDLFIQENQNSLATEQKFMSGRKEKIFIHIYMYVCVHVCIQIYDFLVFSRYLLFLYNIPEKFVHCSYVYLEPVVKCYLFHFHCSLSIFISTCVFFPLEGIARSLNNIPPRSRTGFVGSINTLLILQSGIPFPGNM